MSSDELLLTATANLKKGIEYAIHQVRSKRVDPNSKLRWMRSLTRQVEALVKIAEALNSIESKSSGDLDLATYLSLLKTRIPSDSVQNKRALIARRSLISTIDRAGETIEGKRRLCVDRRELY